MKLNKITKLLLTVVTLMVMTPTFLNAQLAKGNKKVVKENRDIPKFNSLSVGGAFNVYFTQADKTSLIVEADENLLPKIETDVTGDKLSISSNNIKNATALNIYVSNPEIEKIDVSGAASFKSENTFTGKSLVLRASGASQVNLDVEVEELETKASGASDVKLSGSAFYHRISASGAAEVKASGLVTNTSDADASGASEIRINATEEVTSSKSGAGSISVAGNPETITTKGDYNDRDETDFIDNRVESWSRGDTTIVEVGGIKVEVIDGDSTKVAVGNHSLTVDDNGHVKWKRSKINKFKGHWAGFDLGVNGYVDKDFNINVPEEYEYLTLKYEKSIDVHINFFEQNVNIINNKFGLVTGLGLRWNNYRFSDNVILDPDSSSIYGYYDDSKPWRKSKLVVSYLTVPLFFEYQTNRFSKSNSFHLSAGVLFGWRFATHTKMLYFDNGRQKPKTYDSFQLNPFRYDAMVRVGWGVINLYATYSMNTLFKDGRGPELYPFAIGITFLNF